MDKSIIHQLSVREPYYHLLKSGVKTVELRLWDEKRQKIQVGDTIVFLKAENPYDSFSATVISLIHAKNFGELSEMISPQSAGFSNKEALVKTMRSIYSFDAQEKTGVVGIQIQKTVGVPYSK